MQYDSTQYDPQNGSFEPIPEGDYEFLVTDASSAISKNDNDMIELTLEVTVGRDKPITVFDRLVSVKAALWKVHEFCESTGLDYDSNELLPEHCLGRRGQASFILGEANTKGRRYLQVDRYLERERVSDDTAADPSATKSTTQAAVTSSPGGDGIPF